MNAGVSNHLNRVFFPHLPPFKTQLDYLNGIHQNKNVKTKNYKTDNKASYDPIGCLVEIQRKLGHNEEKLKEKREWAKNERKKLDKEWEDLKQQELKFKESFSSFNQFIKTNEEKRKRAHIVLREEKVLCAKRSKDIEKLVEKMEAVKKTIETMEEKISALVMYENYLNKVLNAGHEFRNADSILTRYETLGQMKNLLAKRQNANLEALETAKIRTAKMVEDYKLKILGLNNRVADLRERFSTAARRTLRWENVVLNIKSNSFIKFEELNEVKLSAWNTYVMMCKRKNEVPKLGEEDIERHLAYIKKTLQELQKVKMNAAEKKPRLRKGKR